MHSLTLTRVLSSPTYLKRNVPRTALTPSHCPSSQGLCLCLLLSIAAASLCSASGALPSRAASASQRWNVAPLIPASAPKGSSRTRACVSAPCAAATLCARAGATPCVSRKRAASLSSARCGRSSRCVRAACPWTRLPRGRERVGKGRWHAAARAAGKGAKATPSSRSRVSTASWASLCAPFPPPGTRRRPRPTTLRLPSSLSSRSISRSPRARATSSSS